MADGSWETQEQQGPAPESGSDGFDLRDHLLVFRKRYWLILLVAALGVGLGAAWLSRQTKVYRATASMVIDFSTPQVLGNDVREVVDLGAGAYWTNQEFLETQFKILGSRDVLQRVVELEQLDRDPDFLGIPASLEGEARNQALAAADPAVKLQGMLLVEPLKGSQIVNLGIEDTDPKRAARLANAVVRAYIEYNRDRRLSGTKSASTWLASQQKDLQSKVEASELAIYEFKKAEDILSTSLEDRQNITSQRLIALNEGLNHVLTERVSLQAKLSAVAAARQQRPDDPFWADVLPQVVKSEAISQLRNEYNTAEAEVAALSERYLEKHPQRAAAEEKLASLRKQLAREMEREAKALEVEHKVMLETERSLIALIEGTKREVFEINKREIDFKKLKREEENNLRLYGLVMSRLKDTDLTALLEANNVRPLDAARDPGGPIRPRPSMTLLVALLAGLGLGVALAYLLELLDRTIKSEEDVERALGVPFLGMVPTIDAPGSSKGDRKTDSGRDLFVFRNPKSAAAECLRAIRTNLLFMSPDRELKRLIVTSSGPQEGKTTSAVNIGVTMAVNGSRVLLIDTDMRRPRLHRSFGVANEVGLSTAIVGEIAIEDAIKSTDVPNLFVLPCGPVPPNPAELLHTEKFKQLIDELSRKYDRIIFDTPPLIAVSDAAVLSTVADGTVLVARFRKTSRDLAKRALRTLHDVKAPVLGVVMNDVNLQSREYDYYYYRRYGYYYSETGDQRANA